MKALAIFLLLLLPSLAACQSKIIRIEWWFDNDFENSTAITVSPTDEYNFADQIGTDILPDGLHTIHFRIKNDSGYYSSEITQFIICVSSSTAGASKLDRYEYWFDNDYTNRIEKNITNAGIYVLDKKIGTSNLPNGLHTFHLRFKDANEYYSGEITRFVIALSPSIENSSQINEYEYWFNNDYAGRVHVDLQDAGLVVLNDQFVTDSLPTGVNTFHLRSKDVNGYYSGEITRYIVKLPSSIGGSSQIDRYEYWFDNDYTNHITKNTTDAEVFVLDRKFTTDNLSAGVHIFHIRFIDDNGYYSGEISRFIFKQNTVATSDSILEYRYWFDNDTTEITTVNLQSPVPQYTVLLETELQSPDTGFHDFNIQFLGTNGYWSSVNTSQVYNSANPGISSIMPPQGMQNEDVQCSIYGNGLIPGSTIRFIRSGVDTIFVDTSAITIVAFSKMIFTLNLDGKTIGFYNVVVSVPGASSDLILSNGFEITFGLDYTLDQDGLESVPEVSIYGTDPYNFDTNDDWIADGINVFTGKNPLSNDTDEDGISNLDEINKRTSTILSDTDSDGIKDNADAFPLDPNRSSFPLPDPSDVTAPTITLIEPQ